MADDFLSIDELRDLLFNLNSKYYLNDLWEARESFYHYSKEELKAAHLISALVTLKILEGNIKESSELLETIPEDGNPRSLYAYHLLSAVHPHKDGKDFLRDLEYLKDNNLGFINLSFTAGRPTLINGLRDFSHCGPVLKERKELFMKSLEIMYGDHAEAMYNVAYAEYLYQIDNCLEAMVDIVEQIPVLEKTADMRILFVALCLRMQLLVVNGEVNSASSLVKDIRRRVENHGGKELNHNIDALETKIAIYEGNYDIVNDWLANKAPDEHNNFNLLDVYRYFIKLRCYIINGKFMAGLALSEKLRVMLKQCYRTMDLCELDVLIAIGGVKANLIEESCDALERALELAQKFKYYRLIADEGEPILKLYNIYKKERPNSVYLPFFEKIRDIAKKTAVFYPNYLLSPMAKEVNLTISEKEILSFLSRGMSYGDIAAELNISINTVRYHIKKIYEKLDVNSSNEAVIRAKSLKLM